MARKPLEIDMVAGSQCRDTQGEMLSVEGADISEMEHGRGKLCDNHGKGFFNSLGRITEAKKIFKAEDCENERHRYYWEKVKTPYIYVRGLLYDNEDHQNAKAAAAILRNIHKSDCPLKIKASVEGGVVARGLKDPSLLAQTKIHSVALTFTPANQATLVEPLNLDKSAQDAETDLILIKSVMHLADNNVPSFRDITKAASGIKAARNIKQIQMLIKKMKQEDMEKGMKEMAAGAAMMGALAGGSAEARQPTSISSETPATHQQIIEGLKSKNPTLWAISQVESTGGGNLAHRTLASGQHKGQTAGGPWGMMPKTAAYVLKISPKLRQKYADMAEKSQDIKKNHRVFTDLFNNNPKAAHDFANTLYNHISGIYGGDPDKVIHAWHYGVQGTNKAAQKLGEENIKNDAYVKSVKAKGQPQLVSKALTAGYGGSGAPTDRSGGAVFQSESLDNGRDFKRITCQHCGDEQIYAKHQVKCRSPKCGKSFPLSALYKMMVSNKLK